MLPCITLLYIPYRVQHTELFRDAGALTLSCISSCLYEGIVHFMNSQRGEPFVPNKPIPTFVLP